MKNSTDSNPLFVAVDASTTSIRSIVFDCQGRELQSGRSAFSFKRVGREGYEQNAEDWWTALCSSLKEITNKLGPDQSSQIAGICIAHQRETIVATDENGKALCPALLWMDSRCHSEVAHAERAIGSVRLHAVSGKPACTTPSMYKLMYLFNQHPELKQSAFVHDVHSFLSKRLTGRAVSSFGSADPTGLVDIRKKCWSSSFANFVGVELSRLPELVDVGYASGFLTNDAARATGLSTHVMLYAGCGDGQLAGLGAGVTEKARGFLDLGTAVSCGTITDRYEIDKSFRTLHSALPGRYCLETTLRGGMLTLSWLVEGILGETDRAKAYKRLEVEGRSIPASSEGLVTLPYWAGVMNPYWDDGARGAFIGLHPTHTPAHLYRSVLEGIALEQRLQLEGVRHAVGRANDDLVVMGGGSRSDLWCQIFADVLGYPIRRCQTAHASALGAAVVASVAHGVYPSFERATSEMTRLSTSFEPGPNQHYYDKLYREVYRGLYLDLRDRVGALAEIRELTSPGVPGASPTISAPLENDEDKL